jgi:transposase-like protein
MASTAIWGDLCPGASATTLTPCSSQPTATPDARRRSWGTVLAAEEEEAHRSLGDLLLGRGLPPEAPLSVIGDGAPAIKVGLGVSFPKAQFVRCLGHLSRLVADLGPADLRSAPRRDCRHVLRAPTWEEALECYERFRASWLERAPDSCRALAEGFEEAMAPILPKGPKVRQPTNGLVERMGREFRRFLRPRQAMRSSATAPALVALAVAQINARHRREDWLPAFLGAGVGLPQRLTQFRVPLHT